MPQILDRDRNEGEPPLDQPTNVFFALRPPLLTAHELHAAGEWTRSHLGIWGSPRPPEILHMTVLGLGSRMGRIPPRVLQRILAAIDMVRFPAFEFIFDRAMSFRSSDVSAPFVLAAKDETVGVHALSLALRRALEVKELRVPAKSSFTSHMTIAYSRQRCVPFPVRPLSWFVKDFQLIESWSGKTRYVELKRWSLNELAS